MIFERWNPISGIKGTLYLEALHDDYEGFRVLLKGLDKTDAMLKISFESLLAYRNTDEGNLIRTINQKKYDNWSLYIVKESTFSKWFFSESCGIHKLNFIIHYAIYTPNDCLDVLSLISPKVCWLN